MFLREKRIGGRSYLYLVESVREGGKPKQRIVANLCRKETVVEKGDLDRLYCRCSRMATPRSRRRIGPARLFERLWRDTGCKGIVDRLVEDRQFAFPVERGIFLTVLHRLMVSGSDRGADKWRADQRVDGAEALQLHHLYRIRGHVFCSFLALILAKALEDRLATRTVNAEWADILADIDRLQEIKAEQDGKQFLLRTPTPDCAGKVFQAVGVALPPNIRELTNAPTGSKPPHPSHPPSPEM